MGGGKRSHSESGKSSRSSKRNHSDNDIVSAIRDFSNSSMRSELARQKLPFMEKEDQRAMQRIQFLEKEDQ